MFSYEDFGILFRHVYRTRLFAKKQEEGQQQKEEMQQKKKDGVRKRYSTFVYYFFYFNYLFAFTNFPCVLKHYTVC